MAAELVVVDPPTTIDSLDDALLLHVLSFRLPDLRLLGRCRQLGRRWNTLAGDDQLWRVVCQEHFGLAEARAPSGAPPLAMPTFYHAANQWAALRIGLNLSGLQPELAPLHTSARGAWHGLRAIASSASSPSVVLMRSMQASTVEVTELVSKSKNTSAATGRLFL